MLKHDFTVPRQNHIILQLVMIDLDLTFG